MSTAAAGLHLHRYLFKQSPHHRAMNEWPATRTSAPRLAGRRARTLGARGAAAARWPCRLMSGPHARPAGYNRPPGPSLRDRGVVDEEYLGRVVSVGGRVWRSTASACIPKRRARDGTRHDSTRRGSIMDSASTRSSGFITSCQGLPQVFRRRANGPACFHLLQTEGMR